MSEDHRGKKRRRLRKEYRKTAKGYILNAVLYVATDALIRKIVARNTKLLHHHLKRDIRQLR
ncbi:hypothetical protein [Desulfosarcina sp. BuS5]|uniref:hypothetical protein n=1 Tax=Desulfosarcina sp. BuS5 TaxID=933262 RepID=UPI002378B1BE|nr:hypothetical protein [Desulfosarcina sp. BuS5]